MAYVQQEKIDKLLQLIADLGWEYDRMSTSGQQKHDELCELVGIAVPKNEVTE
jgi:hypothetical protein